MSDNNAITPLEDKPLLNIFGTDEDKNGIGAGPADLHFSSGMELPEPVARHASVIIPKQEKKKRTTASKPKTAVNAAEKTAASTKTAKTSKTVKTAGKAPAKPGKPKAKTTES